MAMRMPGGLKAGGLGCWGFGVLEFQGLTLRRLSYDSSRSSLMMVWS